MSLSFAHLPPGKRHAGIALIRAAVERGVTRFDTAQAYDPFADIESTLAAIRVQGKCCSGQAPRMLDR